jgi:hypothetical protein
MPGVNFELLREQVTMRAVRQQLQFEATVQGRDQGRGPCPVQGSKDPRSRSLSVDVHLGRYQCFVCGSRGRALALWSAVRGVNLPAAAVGLCHLLLGVEGPWVTRW